MDGVSLEDQSPMDLEVGAHMEVVEGRNSIVEITKDFQKIMTSTEEGRVLQTRSLLTMVETGSFETVQEQMKLFSFSTLSWMGYTAAKANLVNEWKLSQDLKNLVSEIIKFLPSARLRKKQDGDVEVFSLCNETVQEAVHDATRLSYHIFIIWNLVIIASHRADDAKEEKKLIFHDLLLHRRQHNELVSNAQNRAAAGFNNTKFDEIMESRSRIDEKFLQLVMKELAEWGQDEMLCHLGQMTEGRGFDNSLYAEKPEADYNFGNRSSKHCNATSFDGAWEIETKVPVLIMKVEGSSYKDSTGKLRWRSDRSLFILPLLSMVARLNIQIQVSMSLTPNLIMFTLGITQVNASFQGEMHNSVEGKKRMGPFFSRISFSVVPVNDRMLTGSVTMTSTSPNTPMRCAVSDQRHLKLGANVAAAPAGVFSLAAVKETKLEVEEKPWLLEQLSVHSGKGGSYTLTLSNLLGNRFDRLKPTPKAKKSILLWSDNIPVNPVQQLPFASDWSINFSTPDAFIWRFPKEFENTTQEFRIKGRMDITYITNINQQMVWETRMMPFECKLEQELAPCH